jgi:hypothetical protein
MRLAMFVGSVCEGLVRFDAHLRGIPSYVFIRSLG